MKVELRDSQTETQGYVSRFEYQPLRPRLRLKGSPQRNSKQKTIPYTKRGHKANESLYKRWAQSQIHLCTKM